MKTIYFIFCLKLIDNLIEYDYDGRISTRLSNRKSCKTKIVISPGDKATKRRPWASGKNVSLEFSNFKFDLLFLLVDVLMWCVGELIGLYGLIPRIMS